MIVDDAVKIGRSVTASGIMSARPKAGNSGGFYSQIRDVEVDQFYRHIIK